MLDLMGYDHSAFGEAHRSMESEVWRGLTSLGQGLVCSKIDFLRADRYNEVHP